MNEKNEIIKDKNCSVEVSINAKSLYSGKLKVYAETIQEAFEKSVIYSEKLNELIKWKNGEKK